MTQTDVQNTIVQYRRLKGLKRELCSRKVVRLNDFKKGLEVEELLKSRLERVINSEKKK